MRDDRPIRAALALALILGALGLLYIQTAETIRSESRRVGYNLVNAADGVHIAPVLPGLPGARAGLADGDRLLAVDGVPIRSQADYGTAARRFQGGMPAAFTVERQGRMLHFTVRPGVPFPLLSYLLNILGALGFLAVALLALSQGARDLRTRLLLGFTSAVGLELLLPGEIIPVIGHGRLGSLSICAFYLLSGIQCALELHLASLIPDRPAWLRRRPWLVPLYYVGGVGFGATLCATFVSEEMLGAHLFPWSSLQADGWLNQFALPLWALAVSALLGSQALRHPEPRGRHQAGLVLSATAAWFLFTLYSAILLLDGRPLPGWLIPLQSFVLLLYPVAIFAAIFRYHLFDIELAVRRGLLYTALSGALVLMFYGALGTLSLLVPSSSLRGDTSIWAVALAMLLLGLLFAPLRRFAHRLIDRSFFPERHELRQRLIALAGELPALGKLPLMGHHLVSQVDDIFGSREAVLLIASPESGLLKVLAATGERWRRWEDGERSSLLLALDDPGFDLLQRAARPLPTSQVTARSPMLAHRLPDLDPRGICVPLLQQQRLVGALLVGAKADGLPYPSEEQDLLALVAHHVASIFENARLFESATYEGLTGLLRREAILEELDKELERAQRYGRPLTLAMADLDYFKEVNDRYGHLAGDTLLKAISTVATEGLRSTDLIGRYGGEEFLILLPETDLAGAGSVAEKIRSLVQRTAVPMDDGTLVGVTISIGLASLRDHHSRQDRLTSRHLIAAADRSLYEAKNGGRNRVFPMVA